jgi:small-conductance mechanosensitive channel
LKVEHIFTNRFLEVKTMEKHTITIEIQSDADPSLILDLAISAAEKLVQDLEDHDHNTMFEDNDVSVETD